MGDCEQFVRFVKEGDFDGVKKSFRSDFLETTDDDKMTPIHYACSTGHIGIARFLIEEKCNIECEDDAGWRPIHHACRHGHVDIVQLLVNNQCELQCKNKCGLTPLELAKRCEHHTCEDCLNEEFEKKEQHSNISNYEDMDAYKLIAGVIKKLIGQDYTEPIKESDGMLGENTKCSGTDCPYCKKPK